MTCGSFQRGGAPVRLAAPLSTRSLPSEPSVRTAGNGHMRAYATKCNASVTSCRTYRASLPSGRWRALAPPPRPWLDMGVSVAGRCTGGVVRIDAASATARLVTRIPNGDCAAAPGLLAAGDQGAAISTARFGQPGDGRCIVRTDPTGRSNGVSEQPDTVGWTDSDTHASVPFDGAAALAGDGAALRVFQWQKFGSRPTPAPSRPFPTAAFEPLASASQPLTDCTASLNPGI